MKKQLNNNLVDRFSRQIILKNIGVTGQKKIISSKEKTSKLFPQKYSILSKQNEKRC